MPRNPDVVSGGDPINPVEEFCQGNAWPASVEQPGASWCLCLLLCSCLGAGQRESGAQPCESLFKNKHIFNMSCGTWRSLHMLRFEDWRFEQVHLRKPPASSWLIQLAFTTGLPGAFPACFAAVHPALSTTSESLVPVPGKPIKCHPCRAVELPFVQESNTFSSSYPCEAGERAIGSICS